MNKFIIMLIRMDFRDYSIREYVIAATAVRHVVFTTSSGPYIWIDNEFRRILMLLWFFLKHLEGEFWLVARFISTKIYWISSVRHYKINTNEFQNINVTNLYIYIYTL